CLDLHTNLHSVLVPVPSQPTQTVKRRNGVDANGPALATLENTLRGSRIRDFQPSPRAPLCALASPSLECGPSRLLPAWEIRYVSAQRGKMTTACGTSGNLASFIRRQEHLYLRLCQSHPIIRHRAFGLLARIRRALKPTRQNGELV